MSCGCNEKNSILKTEDLFEIDTTFKMEVETREISDDKIVSYLDRFVDVRIKRITDTLDEIVPFLAKVSEDDIICLECCYKHLSQACGYYEESKTKQYRFNVFRAVGQMGLAENHVRNNDEMREAIRAERLKLQRGEGEPDWEQLILLIGDK